MKISYEFKVEYVDEYGDIIDSNFFDKFKDLRSYFKDVFATTPIKDALPFGATHADLCVVKDYYTDTEGVKERLHCYLIENGKVPDVSQQAPSTGKSLGGGGVPTTRTDTLSACITVAVKQYWPAGAAVKPDPECLAICGGC